LEAAKCSLNNFLLTFTFKWFCQILDEDALVFVHFTLNVLHVLLLPNGPVVMLMKGFKESPINKRVHSSMLLNIDQKAQIIEESPEYLQLVLLDGDWKQLQQLVVVLTICINLLGQPVILINYLAAALLSFDLGFEITDQFTAQLGILEESILLNTANF
jgi:hypothetical protein